jgi:hypothetical protein
MSIERLLDAVERGDDIGWWVAALVRAGFSPSIGNAGLLLIGSETLPPTVRLQAGSCCGAVRPSGERKHP